MGLLDAMDSPDMAMAMGLLGAGGYSRMPVSTGQGIAQGYGAYQQEATAAGATAKQGDVRHPEAAASNATCAGATITGRAGGGEGQPDAICSPNA